MVRFEGKKISAKVKWQSRKHKTCHTYLIYLYYIHKKVAVQASQRWYSLLCLPVCYSSPFVVLCAGLS